MQIHVEITNTNAHETKILVMSEDRYKELYGEELLSFLRRNRQDGEAIGEGLYLYAEIMKEAEKPPLDLE